MNKSEIIETINKYKLDKEKIIVISGASLVLHNLLNETSDIDICCSEEYSNYLFKNYNCKFERINEYGKCAYLIDDVINFGVSFKPNNIDIINEIRCSSLKDIIELKEFLNRDKDKELIMKLKGLL